MNQTTTTTRTTTTIKSKKIKSMKKTRDIATEHPQCNIEVKLGRDDDTHTTSSSTSGAGTSQAKDIAMEHPHCNIEVKLGTDDDIHKNQEASQMATTKTKLFKSRSRTDTTSITMTNSQDDYDLDMTCRSSSSTVSNSNSSRSSSNNIGGEMIEQPVDEQQFSSQPSFDIEVELGMLQLPGRPPVSNECAICLDCYRLGDAIVCSTNPACQHVFHQDCIVFHCMAHEQKRSSRPFSYRHGTFRQQQLQLQQQRDNANKRETVPCPICRQAFDDIPTTLCSAVTDSGSASTSG
jgi:RING-like zinc finger